jgi:hypothetical protein
MSISPLARRSASWRNAASGFEYSRNVKSRPIPVTTRIPRITSLVGTFSWSLLSARLSTSKGEPTETATRPTA